MVVPGLRRGGGRVVFRPVAVARLAWHMVVRIVGPNVMLTREVLAPTDRLRTAVIGVPLPGCSDELLTLVSNLVALSPGTMPLELTHGPTVLYVHVLHLRDLEATRRDIFHLTDLTVRRVRLGGVRRRAGRVPPRSGVVVISVIYVVLGLAAALFAYRLLRGLPSPTVLIGIDGMIATGIGADLVSGHGHRPGSVHPLRRRAGAGVVHQHASSPASSKVAASDRRIDRPRGAVLILLSAVGVVRFADVLHECTP